MSVKVLDPAILCANPAVAPWSLRQAGASGTQGSTGLWAHSLVAGFMEPLLLQWAQNPGGWGRVVPSALKSVTHKETSQPPVPARNLQLLEASSAPSSPALGCFFPSHHPFLPSSPSSPILKVGWAETYLCSPPHPDTLLPLSNPIFLHLTYNLVHPAPPVRYTLQAITLAIPLPWNPSLLFSTDPHLWLWSPPSRDFSDAELTP